MKDLIEALTILSKYNNDYAPTHCEHDNFFVTCDTSKVLADEVERLEELGFHKSEYGFVSYRFGSC